MTQPVIGGLVRSTIASVNGSGPQVALMTSTRTDCDPNACAVQTKTAARIAAANSGLHITEPYAVARHALA